MNKRLILLMLTSMVVGIVVGTIASPYLSITGSVKEVETKTYTRALTLVSTVPTTITLPADTITTTLTSIQLQTSVVSIPVTTTIPVISTATTTEVMTMVKFIGMEESPSPRPLFEFYLPWNDSVPSSIDLSGYLHKPAGRYGHVYVGSDGHLYVGNQRIRFLGVSLVASSAFPSKEVADAIAQRLAKYGVNLVRFHALDANWGSNIFLSPGTRRLNSVYLDRMDYLVYRLKENGIYVNFNLLCYRSFSSVDGLPKEVDAMQVKDKHILGFFYNPARDLQKEFAKALLTHVNPYTGLSYTEDPAVAMVEILNEYGMVFGWFDGAIDRLPQIFKDELGKVWNEYLRNKYGSTESLLNAWGRVEENENLEKGTIRIFTLSEYDRRPPRAQQDWVEFMWYLDYNYFTDMHNFLKNELGVKALIAGTQVSWGGMPNIMQVLDIIDSHNYWRYPERFGADWFVRNSPMVVYPSDNTIARLAYMRVYGKPFTVSEYNHPAPNMFRAEGMVFLSAYGAFQDWDAIMFYCYGDSGGAPIFDSKRMRSTLDIDQDPARWSLMITAYMLFVRGDVSTARHWMAVELPRETEIDLVKRRIAGVWNLPYGMHLNPPAVAPLLHGVGLITTNGTRPVDVLSPKDVKLPNVPLYVSDTSELLWNCTDKGSCVFVVNTSRSIVLTGFVGGRRYEFGNIVIEVGKTLLDNWATIALHVVEGTSFKDAKRIIVIAVGATFNTDMHLYEIVTRELLFRATVNATEIPIKIGERITTLGLWGKAPTIAEGIEVKITLRTEKDVRAYALNNLGLPVQGIDMEMFRDFKSIFVGSRYRTIWYEIRFGN